MLLEVSGWQRQAEPDTFESPQAEVSSKQVYFAMHPHNKEKPCRPKTETDLDKRVRECISQPWLEGGLPIQSIGQRWSTCRFV